MLTPPFKLNLPRSGRSKPMGESKKKYTPKGMTNIRPITTPNTDFLSPVFSNRLLFQRQ